MVWALQSKGSPNIHSLAQSTYTIPTRTITSWHFSTIFINGITILNIYFFPKSTSLKYAQRRNHCFSISQVVICLFGPWILIIKDYMLLRMNKGKNSLHYIHTGTASSRFFNLWSNQFSLQPFYIICDSKAPKTTNSSWDTIFPDTMCLAYCRYELHLTLKVHNHAFCVFLPENATFLTKIGSPWSGRS